MATDCHNAKVATSPDRSRRADDGKTCPERKQPSVSEQAVETPRSCAGDGSGTLDARRGRRPRGAVNGEAMAATQTDGGERAKPREETGRVPRKQTKTASASGAAWLKANCTFFPADG